MRRVVLKRAERPGWWAPGYWTQLVGCGIRMPTGLVEGRRSLEGVLVAADEGDEKIILTFADVAPEGVGE